MKLDKIMIKEAKNEADIVLYRHGLFLRAYERSTYHLSTLCQFKVIYKYIKYLKQDVVYSGFPESSLDRIRASANNEGWSMFTHNDGVRFVREIPEPFFGIEAFEQWRQQHLQPLLPVMKNTPNRQSELCVIARLKKFPVECKTPFEALQFVMELKQLLEQENG